MTSADHTDAVRVRVLFFARSREVAGCSEKEFILPSTAPQDRAQSADSGLTGQGQHQQLGGGSGTNGATTAALLQSLLEAFPGLASVMASCVFAVNQVRGGGGIASA
jgi:hypothetical protein